MMQNPLDSTYRPIRRIAPPDVPIAGVLAAQGENTVLLTDVDTVPTQWWRDAPAAHLLAPRDVARRADGHDAVLPWCVVTVGSYLRARADEPLSGGEGVTLAVSLMRGCAEAALPARFGDDPIAVPHGRWWLTDQGKPLFAVGEGAAAREETAELLGVLASTCADRVVARLATEAADSIRVRSPVAVLVRLEESMFEACAPRPLLVRIADPLTLRPLGARELRPQGESDGEVTAPRFIGAGEGQQARSGSAARWWDGVRAAGTRLLHRGDRRREPHQRSRRTPLLVGASLAATILAVGLLWPQPDGESGENAAAAASAPPSAGPGNAAPDASPAEPQVTSATVIEGAEGTPGGEGRPTDGASAPEAEQTAIVPTAPEPAPSLPAEDGAGPTSSRDAEVVATAAALLAAVAECRPQQSCGPLLAEGVDMARVPAGGEIQLLEDFGGVAVLRVVADDAVASLISIERVDGAWRVREATTVTG